MLLVVLLGSALVWITSYTTGMYSQEVTQRLNSPIAMYVTNEQQLIHSGQVNKPALQELAHRAMTINPSVEIYLIDTKGLILGHAMPPESVVVKTVSMEPIKKFLAESEALPIFGDDPRAGKENKVFSVSPILEDGAVVGYLYAVLGGQKYESIRRAVEDSFILQIGLATVIGSLLLALVAALVIFFVLTRRLTGLQRSIEEFQQKGLSSNFVLDIRESGQDEIDRLAVSFQTMVTRIHQQFEALQHMDKTRRELIANVSHDLRTPLASLQGYIETLIIKKDELDGATRQHYLEIAYKHSNRLNSLIAELFELAKLDSGDIELNSENFSLVELVYDCVQDYELQARNRSVRLSVQVDGENPFVYADIALIQRVLQNLIDNALRHTPPGREIMVKLRDSEANATIEVIDTGKGIAKHEIPHIFERFYHAKDNEPSEEIGSGLGLAIVKKILELHQSSIRVRSELNHGTSFSFELPLKSA
jgi:two-component system, OmpR family, sensor kinase